MSLTFVHAPRISLATFTAVLSRGKSPALPEAEALYNTCVQAGIDPAVALAFYLHESSLGTAGINVTFDLRNWGSVRAPFDPAAASIVAVPGNGNFAKYTSWTKALADWCVRIQRRYVDNGLDTVALAVPVYAPSSDGNSPAQYIAAVEKAVAQWIAEDTGPMALMIDTTTYRSPNFNERPVGHRPIALLLHTTEGAWPSDAEWLCSVTSQVSSHYVISPQAKVYQLVDDDKRAWHAGVGTYAGFGDWNNISIGIEVSHVEHHAWAAGQREVLRDLCLSLIATYGITQPLIAAHRWIAPDRRRDPTDFPDGDLKSWIAALYSGGGGIPDYEKLWHARHPEIAYNASFGFPTKYRAEYDAGRPLGAVLSPELGDTVVWQVFEQGVLKLVKVTNTITVLR